MSCYCDHLRPSGIPNGSPEKVTQHSKPPEEHLKTSTRCTRNIKEAELPLGRLLVELTQRTALPALSCPITLLHCEDDQLMPASVTDAVFAAACKGQAAHVSKLQEDPTTGASGATLQVDTLTSPRVAYLRFGLGGHNMTWPVNWRAYSQAILWRLVGCASTLEGANGRWLEDFRARHAEGAGPKKCIIA